MNVLKNMKFRIADEEQGVRLQETLFAMGYDWENPSKIPVRCNAWFLLYADVDNKTLYTGTWDADSYEETATEAFIALHTDKPFEGLEEAYNEPKSIGGSPWFENNGTIPDLPEGTSVDISMDGYGVLEGTTTDAWRWDTGGSGLGLILKWRYTHAKDYFKAPKTPGAKPKSQITIKPLPDGSEAKLLTAIFGDAEAPAHNKYSREVKPGVFVDVYDVIRAFNVVDPCLQHLLKKALATGKRGHKDAREDYQDIVASAQRALDMHIEWSAK